MSTYEATFEIRSKSDAHAVRLLVERMYDAIREEVWEVQDGSAISSEGLDVLRDIREEVRTPKPGTLTIVYESRPDSFED